jgi:hypothetical protein
MELKEAVEKYRNKTVCHMATGLTFEVYEIIELGRLTKDRIEFKFKHPTLDDIPIGQQTSSSLREIEAHYRIIS